MCHGRYSYAAQAVLCQHSQNAGTHNQHHSDIAPSHGINKSVNMPFLYAKLTINNELFAII
ncbi:hypothetical protein A9B99_18405 [Mangrovibacter phragmitis]|uniref:Uncharacterized protein n=1 Tax=Mangrovibacter phragmitis TaxID=1691903 RepID=A0A1B7L752_9ENTR|nr:hypothetical protein A9B99_18405 [Mangrovibacter phragmitis]